jgi:hypothetical protein
MTAIEILNPENGSPLIEKFRSVVRSAVYKLDDFTE